MSKIEVMQGDITTLATDAIVNAANTSLMGGGGVDGAIHRAGGPQILEECRKIVARQGGCPTGEAVITTGGKLKARCVIHTVGPVWNGRPKDDDLLTRAYENSLRVAVENGMRTVAFPNISTGVYRFPKEQAADIAIAAVQRFLEKESSLEKVIFCCFDAENLALYQARLSKS